MCLEKQNPITLLCWGGSSLLIQYVQPWQDRAAIANTRRTLIYHLLSPTRRYLRQVLLAPNTTVKRKYCIVMVQQLCFNLLVEIFIFDPLAYEQVAFTKCLSIWLNAERERKRFDQFRPNLRHYVLTRTEQIDEKGV